MRPKRREQRNPKLVRTLGWNRYGGGERLKRGTYEDAAAAFGEIDGDGVEVAVCSTGVGDGRGDGEGAEDTVEEDAVGRHGRRQGLHPLAENIVDRHPGPRADAASSTLLATREGRTARTGTWTAERQPCSTRDRDTASDATPTWRAHVAGCDMP